MENTGYTMSLGAAAEWMMGHPMWKLKDQDGDIWFYDDGPQAFFLTSHTAGTEEANLFCTFMAGHRFRIVAKESVEEEQYTQMIRLLAGVARFGLGPECIKSLQDTVGLNCSEAYGILDRASAEYRAKMHSD